MASGLGAMTAAVKLGFISGFDARSTTSASLCKTSFATTRSTCQNAAVPATVQGMSTVKAVQKSYLWLATSSRSSVRVSAVEGSAAGTPEAKLSEAADGEPKSTLDIVRGVIAVQLAVPVSQVEPQTKFVDLGADSLDTVEIMMSLEEKFGIQIEEEGSEKITTVKDAADLIEQVRAGK